MSLSYFIKAGGQPPAGKPKMPRKPAANRPPRRKTSGATTKPPRPSIPEKIDQLAKFTGWILSSFSCPPLAVCDF